MSKEENGQRIMLEELRKAMNDPKRDDPFFFRPDGIADMWWIFYNNHNSIFHTTMINWLANTLISVFKEVNKNESFQYPWYVQKGIRIPDFDPQHIATVDRIRSEMQINESSFTEKWSIRDCAGQVAATRKYLDGTECYEEYNKHPFNEWKKLLAFRLQCVHPDFYYGEGWYELSSDLREHLRDKYARV